MRTPTAFYLPSPSAAFRQAACAGLSSSSDFFKTGCTSESPQRTNKSKKEPIDI